MTVEASATWTDHDRFVGVSSSRHAIVVDAAKEKTANSPMELVLIGLCGCTAADVFQAGERFPLLAQDVDDIGSRAAAQANQNQFHGAVGRLLLGSVYYHGMAAGGYSKEALTVGPSCSGFGHFPLPFWIAGCQLPIVFLGRAARSHENCCELVGFRNQGLPISLTRPDSHRSTI